MKGNLLLWFLSLVCVCTASISQVDAQGQNSPSVQHYLDSIRPYVNNFRQTDPKGVMNVLLKAEQMNKDSSLMVKIYIGIISTSMEIGDYKRASEFLVKHRRLSHKLNNSLINLFYNYSNSGSYFYNVGDYDSALIYQRKTLLIAEMLNKSKAATKLNIGLLYETIGDVNNALEFYSNSLLEAYDSVRYWQSRDTFYYKESIRVSTIVASNLLVYATNTGDLAKAEFGKAYLDTLITNHKSEIVGFNLMTFHNAIGLLEMISMNLGNAKKHAYQLLALATENGNNYFKIRAVDLVAQISLKSKGEVIGYDEANKLMWTVGENMRQNDRIDIYLLRSLLFMRLNAVDSALYFDEKYNVLKKFDGQVLNNVKRNIDQVLSNATLSKRYSSDIQQLEILSRKQDERFYFILFISGLLIIPSIVLIAYHFWKRRQQVSLP